MQMQVHFSYIPIARNSKHRFNKIQQQHTMKYNLYVQSEAWYDLLLPAAARSHKVLQTYFKQPLRAVKSAFALDPTGALYSHLSGTGEREVRYLNRSTVKGIKHFQDFNVQGWTICDSGRIHLFTHIQWVNTFFMQSLWADCCLSISLHGCGI